MRAFLFFILGFAASFLAYTLFGNYAFLAQAIVLSIALFLLFFREKTVDGLYFTFGLTLALEGLGTSHFGLASALSFFIFLMYQLFALRLHFTSLYLRYLVALLLVLGVYAIALFSSAGLGTRLFQLALLYPVIALVIYFLSTLREKPTYELL